MENIMLFFQNPQSYVLSRSIGIIFIVILISVAFLCYKIHEETYENTVPMFAIVSIIFVLFWGAFCDFEVSEVAAYEVKQEHLNTALENNYRAYINGVEVDIKTIDLSSFSDSKVDDENKQVLITID